MLNIFEKKYTFKKYSKLVAPVWPTIFKSDCNNIERKQHRATDIVSSTRSLPYESRLKRFDLIKVVKRWKRGDIIQMYKYYKEISSQQHREKVL